MKFQIYNIFLKIFYCLSAVFNFKFFDFLESVLCLKKSGWSIGTLANKQIVAVACLHYWYSQSECCMQYAPVLACHYILYALMTHQTHTALLLHALAFTLHYLLPRLRIHDTINILYSAQINQFFVFLIRSKLISVYCFGH